MIATRPATGVPALSIWLATLAGAAALCWPTIVELYAQWATSTGHYSHGLLLLALGGWFVWSYRHGLKIDLGWHSYLGIAVLLGGYALWQLAGLGNVLVVQYVGLSVLLAGLWLALFGWDSIRDCLWRFGIVGLALPIWDVLNGTLQVIAGFFVGRLLALAGVPHHLDNTFVTLPNGAFEIAGGCSGLGFLMTGLSLAFYLLATSELKWLRVMVVVTLSVAIALITNWVRIAVIIYVGYRSDMTSSLVSDHLWVGWVAFAILAFPLFLVLSSRLPQVEPPTPGNVTKTAGWARGPLLALAGALAAVFVLRAYFAVQQPAPAATTRIAIAASDSAAECPTQAPGFWDPVYEGADLRARTALCDSGSDAVVWLDVAYYANESQGKELVFHANDPIGVRASGAAETVSLANARVNSFQFDMGERSWLVWQWYQVGDERLAGATETKLAQIRARFRQRSSAMSISTLTRCETPACTAASAVATRVFQQTAFSLTDSSGPSHAQPSPASGRDFE